MQIERVGTQPILPVGEHLQQGSNAVTADLAAALIVKTSEVFAWQKVYNELADKYNQLADMLEAVTASVEENASE